MSKWDEVFDAHGLKSVAPNDKNKRAYVPSQEQKDVLARAGLIPVDDGPRPAIAIRILGDPDRSTVEASYYRAQGHPGREPRMGRKFISSWLKRDDELLVGFKDGQLFVAKVQDPATHAAILEELHNALANPASAIANQRVRPRTDDGHVLRAEFSVSGRAPVYIVTFECGDGRRHTEYAQALELILTRLATLDAELVSARLATAVALKRAETEHLDTALRPAGFVLPQKIAASEAPRLRKALGNAGAAIGKPPKTSGNSTKRIELHIRIGPSVETAVELQGLLAEGLESSFRDQVELDREDVRVLARKVDPQALERLREKYVGATPEVKARLSYHIERGGVGEGVKRACQYRCQICEALGNESLGFEKRSGGHYVEAHHVLPVSGLEAGSLGPSNVISVCPNHHRQIHYGKVSFAEHSDEFVFNLDGAPVRIRRN